MKDTTKHIRAAERSDEDAVEDAKDTAAETGRTTRAQEQSFKEALESGREMTDQSSRAFREAAERGSETVRQVAGRGAELARENISRSGEIFQRQSKRAGEVAEKAADIVAAAAEASRRDMNVFMELGTVWSRSLREFGTGLGVPQQALGRIVESMRSLREAQSDLIRETTSALLKANVHLSEVSSQMAQNALERIRQTAQDETGETQDEDREEEEPKGWRRQSAPRA